MSIHMHFKLNMLIQVYRLWRDERVFTYRQQECICVYVHVSLCAANTQFKARSVCLCEVCIPIRVPEKLVRF